MSFDLSQLRYGNIFHYRGSERVVNHHFWRAITLTPEYENDCEFIPVNNEWIAKLGLPEFNNDQLFHFKKDGFEYLWTTAEGLKVFCMDVPFGSHPCEFVHQLQNLYFAITGEELTLN